RSSLLVALAFGAPAHAGTEPLPLVAQALGVGERNVTVQVPAGYTLELVSDRLERPRMARFTPAGELLIGSRSGKLYRLRADASEPELLADLGGYPHAVAVRGDELLVARTEGLYRAAYRAGQPPLARDDFSLLLRLPSGGGHSSRTVAVGPDGRVYVSVGISGNCSEEYLDDSFPFPIRRGGVFVLDESRTRPEWAPFASGLRNPVGFDWNPADGVLYATNNGPDHHGFEQPPEYFSRLERNSFHGMPWFVHDGDKLRRDPCQGSTPPRPEGHVWPPAATFPARNAPLGMAFVPPAAADPRLAGDAVVALHGSWATLPDGGPNGDPASRRPPKLVLVRFAGGVPVQVDDLVTGFQLADGARWARPAGVAVAADGTLYFTSDDGLQGLFRLRRQ
ncbi:MAG TPA: sugar dehydrogenase, partial [Gammaproteobacteria bacterium]